MSAQAIQLLVDCDSVDIEALLNQKRLPQLLQRSVEAAGGTVSQCVERLQREQDYSCSLLLSEGSLVLHTDCAQRRLYLDVLSWDPQVDPEAIVGHIKALMGLTRVSLCWITRGHLPTDRAEQGAESLSFEPADEFSGDDSAIRAALVKAKARYSQPLSAASLDHG